MDAVDALTEGIEPDWWRRTIAGLLPPGQMLAVYASGSGRWDQVIRRLELRGDPALLVLTPGSLLGMRLHQAGDQSSLHVERWSVTLDHVSSVASAWDAWFDPQTAGVSDVGHFRVTIQMEAPLGELGASITLPINPREDYEGRWEVSGARARTFAESLEGSLARGHSAG